MARIGDALWRSTEAAADAADDAQLQLEQLIDQYVRVRVCDWLYLQDWTSRAGCTSMFCRLETTDQRRVLTSRQCAVH